MTLKETYVNCNLCGENNFKIVFKEGQAQIHRIVKCNSCGLLYANPQKDNISEVEQAYVKSEKTENALNSELVNQQYSEEHQQYLKKQFLQLKDYAKIIEFVDSKEKGTFLEIGSYAGVFLNEAKKKGWNVIGIEPLELPAIYSEEHFGIKVIREYFEKSDLPNASIDVIVACHVIEHVADPAYFVRHACELLKPGGILILETPTYDSFTFKILKHRERSVRCDGHIYFFTKDTLKQLVEKNGLKVQKHDYVGRTLTMDRLFYNFGIITGKKEFFNRISNKMGLNNFIIRLNMKDMQRIYCIKK